MLYDNIVIGAVRRPVQNHGRYVELGQGLRAPPRLGIRRRGGRGVDHRARGGRVDGLVRTSAIQARATPKSAPVP